MSPQVSRTFLSIQANLSDDVVWIVSTCHLISKLSSPFSNPFEIVPSATTTISITVSFIFHSFFSSRDRSRYLSLFSPSAGLDFLHNSLWIIFAAQCLVLYSFCANLWHIWLIVSSSSSHNLHLLLLLLLLLESFSHQN